MTQAIAQYEPRHKIVLWDESEVYIKSVHVPHLEAELKNPETSFVRIGEDIIHKNSIKLIRPAVQHVSELEKALTGKSQDIKEKVRKKVKALEADGKVITPGVIQNIIEHYERI